MVRNGGRRSVATLAIVLVCLFAAAGCDWLQPGFTGGHSYFNQYEPALTKDTVGSLTQRFTLSLSDGTLGAPIVVNGTLFASAYLPASDTAQVRAFGAGEGTPRWTTTLATGVLAPSNVAYSGGLVIVVASDGANGNVYALDARTGSVRWTHPIGSSLVYDPALDDGRLFVATHDSGSFDTGLTAIDPATGSTLWTTSFQALLPVSGPIAADGYVSIADAQPLGAGSDQTYVEFRVYDQVTGSQVPASGAGVPAAANGRLYAVATSPLPPFDSSLYEFDPSNSNAGWSVPSPIGDYFHGAINESSIISLSGTTLVAIDTANGATQWSTPLPDGTTASSDPVIADNLAYVVATTATGANLCAYDTATGTLAATAPVVGGKPIVAEGHVYIWGNGPITAYAPAA